LDDNCSGEPDDDDGGCENLRTDPVHVGTGAFTTDPLVDVRFEGAAVPIEFSRRFDSMAGWNIEVDSAAFIGEGWSHSFGARLFTSGLLPLSTTPTSWSTATTVVNRTPEGQGRSFACPAWVGSGWQCTTSDGSYDVLTWETGTSRFRVDHGDGLQTWYGPTGLLLEHRNRAGDGWSVAYSSGRISTVTDHFGRVLTFGYSGPSSIGLHRISSLTVGGTTLATFTHGGSMGIHLTTATSAAGDEGYAYDPVTLSGTTYERPFITQITRGGTAAVTVTYDHTSLSGLGHGRVATIVAPDGDYVFRWPGSPTTLCAGSRTTMIIDRSQSLLSCTVDADCAGVGEPATCDSGTCRAYTCQEFEAGPGSSVRFDETVTINGNCPCGGGETFTYDTTGASENPRGRMTRTNRDGTVTSYHYDSFGRLEAECENDVIDPGDTEYEVTTDQSSCPPDGVWRSFTYHSTYRSLLATESRRSRFSGTVITTTYGYDSNGLVTSTARQGYTYNSSGTPTLETQTTTYTRDGFGRVTRVTGPATSQRTDYWYHTTAGAQYGMLMWQDTYYSSTGFNWAAYTSYSPLGHPLSVSPVAGSSETRSYTYAYGGMRLATATHSGLTSTFNYTNGRLSCVAEATGRTIRYVYDSRGRPYEVRLSDQPCATAPTNYDYVRYTYDAAGRRTAVLVARQTGGSSVTAATWSATYDTHGHTSSTTLGPAAATTFTYDAAAMGYLATTTRGDGDLEELGDYDDFGRARTATRWFTGSVDATHELDFIAPTPVPEVGASTPIVVTDPGAETRGYVWDDFGHLISATSDDWDGTARSWYEQGRLREVLHPDGRRSVYSYDARGRVTAVDHDADHPSLVGPDYTFTYESTTGSPACPSGTVSLCGYRRGRLATVGIEAAPGVTWTMQYDYDPWGNVNYERYPDGRYSRYEHDASGRLSYLTAPTSTTDRMRFVYDSTAGNHLDQTEVIQIIGERNTGTWGTWLTWATGIQRNATGAITSVLTHDSAASYPHTLTYRTDGRLSSFRFRRRNGSSYTDVVNRSAYSYAADGEYTGHNAVLTADFDRTYFLDGANRLTCAASTYGAASCPTGSTLVESFIYDGSDNRLSSTTPAGATTGWLDGNRIGGVEPPGGRIVEYAYDGGGRRALDEDTAGVPSATREYSYDTLGRLSGMTLARVGATSGTYEPWTLAIVYDHRSRPLFVSAVNGTTSVESRFFYYYDRDDRLLGSTTMPDATVPTTYYPNTYTHIERTGITGWRGAAVTSGGTSEAWFYSASGPEGMPIATYYTTRTGTVVTGDYWRATSISPFGTVTAPAPPIWGFEGQLTLPLSDATAWVGGVATTLRPPLYLNRWRVYDSFVGQYLQPEPLAVRGSEHMTSPYAYARVRPWNVTDPTGEQGWEEAALCALVAEAAAGGALSFLLGHALADTLTRRCRPPAPPPFFFPFDSSPRPGGECAIRDRPRRPDPRRPRPIDDPPPPVPPYTPDDEEYCREHLIRCNERRNDEAPHEGRTSVCSVCYRHCRIEGYWPSGYRTTDGWVSCAY
jgi:RHS repeat-associated protein